MFALLWFTFEQKSAWPFFSVVLLDTPRQYLCLVLLSTGTWINKLWPLCFHDLFTYPSFGMPYGGRPPFNSLSSSCIPALLNSYYQHQQRSRLVSKKWHQMALSAMFFASFLICTAFMNLAHHITLWFFLFLHHLFAPLQGYRISYNLINFGQKDYTCFHSLALL